MGYTYEGKPRNEWTPDALDRLMADIEEQARREKERKQRHTRLQLALLASTAGLLLALAIILVTGVLP